MLKHGILYPQLNVLLSRVRHAGWRWSQYSNILLESA
jgi:hypothetical protein